MKRDRRLTFWLKRLIDKTIDLSALSEPSSSTNYEIEGRKMENENSTNYTRDQIAEIYAKLEVAKMLTKMGTDMAKQATNDIRFYRMTNGLEEDDWTDS